MEDLKATLLARFEAVDTKFEALEKVQTHLEEINGKLQNHAEALEKMQVKVNLSMDSLGKVQEEQNGVTSSLKGPGVTPLTIAHRDDSGILGEPPDRWTNQQPPLALGETTAVPKIVKRRKVLVIVILAVLVPFVTKVILMRSKFGLDSTPNMSACGVC